MGNYILFCLLLIMQISFESLVWAHPHSTPVRAQMMIEDNEKSSNNIGGYGYIASSEAESYNSFEFGCSTRDLNRYYQCGSGGLVHPWGDQRDSLVTSIRATYKAVVLQRLREQMAEKLIFEHAALTGVGSGTSRANWPPAMPSCLAASTERRGRYATSDGKRNQLASLHRSLPEGMTPITAIRTMPEERRPQANKFNSMINSYSSGNLVRSVMLHDQLKTRKDQFCLHDRTTYGRNICTDLQNQLARIESSYPLLYGTAANPVASNHLDNLRNAIYDVVGASSSGSDSQRRSRGRSLYRTHTRIPSGSYSADEYKDFEAAISKKVEDAHTASRVAAASRTPAQRHAADAFDSLNQNINHLQTTYRDSLQNRMDGICSPDPGMQLADFVRSNPNVVRQMMADASPMDRDALRMVLCAENLQSSLAPKPQCRGVTSSTTADGDIVTVNRSSSSWPYSSSNNYTIIYPTTPVAAPPTVRMEINFPTSIRPRDKAQAFLDTFKNNVQGFYNCSGGKTPPTTFGPTTSGCLDPTDPSCTADQIETLPQMKCPPHPGAQRVNFEFNFTPKYLCQGSETPTGDRCIRNAAGAREPKMILHQCYNADMSGSAATDCTQVRTFAINKCRESSRRVIASGRVVVNEAASEFDDYLDNIVRPFESTSSAGPVGTTNRCNADPAHPIDNSTASTTHCTGLSESVTISGSVVNCRQECITAVRECRTPSLGCWNEDMITSYCEGRRTNTGRWDGTPSPSGHRRFNRADSGNLTTSVNNSVFIHEVGHVLNLDDEYQDATYPFLPQGEHDSMMNHSRPGARFYPRHFNGMLQPARCQRVGPYAEEGAVL